MTGGFVTGVVLAAGTSRRLGTAKQLLPYRNTTVLGATLDVVRSCAFDQMIVTLGGSAEAIRQRVDLTGLAVVMAEDFGSGCSSSLRSALRSVDPRADGIVLVLGDQPGLSATTVDRLIAEGTTGAITVCRYRDGLGHPFWLSRGMFGELAELHGDKAVWKIIESGRVPVSLLDVDAPVPLDVDTWDDYERLRAASPP
ncbi:nucleotidyltransferase family protein [Nocardia amikacinitolerans]|uniref:nucleotidyltransferase family protein n=1 Tax=Nocardia amikacinitolerans TaxID=756689 RepID=UPI0020A47051|nr:nucleotidyltransferase family protein [Nocardia amikacinitolerans]MCP2279290.1 molybdenum cofactor cytidylyltransferase [Nocardia amikacinitolerans]